MLKIRLEGTKKQLFYFAPELDKIGKVISVSKFYPNKAFNFERSIPQEDGRIYIELEEKTEK